MAQPSTDFEVQLDQCKQLIMAIVLQYGKDSEYGKFLDVDDNAMLMTTSNTPLFIAPMMDAKKLRLLVNTAKPLLENQTSLQVCPVCKCEEGQKHEPYCSQLQPQDCTREVGHDGPCNGWPCETAKAVMEKRAAGTLNAIQRKTYDVMDREKPC